ncbi:retrovirus-related pol polyprotein from transposon TNT 1-94 [Tanacetum coccineum]|uniref:Retrovirus-related pol polyprotein from transposon TNT 1-94 n=1 Tax=Tanacetum coccineum TaxID=301880 RepID=A0ABQ4XKK6_9ASTR
MTKRHSKEAKTTRMAKVKGSVLDAVTQIISLENFQNHQEIRTKWPLLEVLGVIVVRKMIKRIKTKHVSWLKHLVSLENEISELKEKVSKLEKNKEVDLECTMYQTLKIENEKLKEEAFKLTQFEKSTHSLKEILSFQKPFEESLNWTFDETPFPSKTSPLVDDNLDKEEAIKVTEKKNLKNDIEDETLEIDEIVNINESKNHSLDNVIGNLNQRTLWPQAQDKSNFFSFILIIKPKNVSDALKDESWVVTMQEELNQFISNDVWELVPLPKNVTIIGTKWVFRNKLDENGIVSRNKARFVAQGYNQQEGIDYNETYALVAR